MELNGCHSDSKDEAIATVGNFLAILNMDFCEKGIHTFLHCWTKCVNVEVIYVKKTLNVQGFLILTPFTLGRELINQLLNDNK